MQFIPNGPDIHDALLHAHEEGRVVFFCGAGISYPAGLPDFKGLVDKIYKIAGTTHSDLERKADDRGQFDTTLDLLERRIQGQRTAVRNALAEALQPKLRRKGATDTHTALLQLARNRKGDLRLVTTNFDRIFECVAEQSNQPHCVHAAPMLPIPKDSRWNGLVYLHGLLPANKNDESALQRLILTSGDFGLAYLLDGWAARFVGSLFRNYVVCFVGYSINDPVIRYLMDALAADRLLGEMTPKAYALGGYKADQKHDKIIDDWKAKGVEPILYEVPAGSRGSRKHSALHQTLIKCAETYRNAVFGKEHIVVEYATALPSTSTKQDDFVGRMLWALSDASGLPAKRFAKHDPVPPIEWLSALSEDRYQHSDLNHFGISPNSKSDPELRFSLIRRPAPYTHAPRMALVGSNSVSDWDDVMSWIAHWLTRHLNDPQLILWFSERGGQLHRRWILLLEGRLNELASLKHNGDTDKLDKIRSNAPNAIPNQMMRVLWRLLLTGRVKSFQQDPLHNIYHWKNRLQRDGLNTTLRLELRELLAPMFALKKPFHLRNDEVSSESPMRLGQLVGWELVLATEDVRSALRDPTDQQWEVPSRELRELVDDFQQLLRDALDLLREVDVSEGRERSDRSYWDLPSISPHWQNRGFPDWVVLIELLRDAWLAVREVAPARATRIAQGWFDLPYPTFKRLALFAASQDDCISPEQWVEWLISDDAWGLWSLDTQRECCRLLALQGHRLTTSQERLEGAILLGLPREKSPYLNALEPERWQKHVDHSMWLCLAKLNESGLRLGDVARVQLEHLSAAHPDLHLAPHEREEFSFWMSATNDPDYEKEKDVDIAPRKRRELVQWLKQYPAKRRSHYGDEIQDHWRDTCRTRFYHCIFALCDLAQEGNWPADRWREALYAWSQEGQVQRSWRYAASLVQTMPGDTLQEIARAVTSWLEAVSKFINGHEDILLNLCRRVLELPLEMDSGMTKINAAINHPIGHVTHSLLNLWFKRDLNDHDGLPADIAPLFTKLCDTTVDRFSNGRVLLASKLIVLFRVDRNWTEQYLLPLFAWDVNQTEASAA